MKVEDQSSKSEELSNWFTARSLDDSLHSGECLICSNLVHSERHAIHSFLWEGMMSPIVRDRFLKGQGFCTRHFWMAMHVEEEDWPAGGIGVAILCENLVAQALKAFPEEKNFGTSWSATPFRHKGELVAPVAGVGCMFCIDWAEREKSLVMKLEQLHRMPEWSEKLGQSPLCLRHALSSAVAWKDSEEKRQIRNTLERRLREIQADLTEFIRKHDWNLRNEPLGREEEAVERAIEMLAGLERQFPRRRTRVEGGRANGTRRR